MKSKVVFADARLKKAFESLKESRTEDKRLYDGLLKAFKDLEKDAFCGIQIQKKLIPKEYKKKYEIDNLWKYNLPNAWRLIYSVAADKILTRYNIKRWDKISF